MSRDLLYRSVFRSIQDSPQYGDCYSPVTSLAQSLHASSLVHTPCKRLSLSSSISDTSSCQDISLNMMSSPNEASKCRLSCSPCTPPKQCSSPKNKENIPMHYYSPCHCLPSIPSKLSPFKEVQNTVNKTLVFSPLKKLITPSEKEFLSPSKKASPLEECDSTSRDSGFSESSQKLERFIAPVTCAPTRRLNLDMSPPKINVNKITYDKMPVRSFASLSRSRNEDDFLMDFLSVEEDNIDVVDDVPSAFNSLLSAPIQCIQANLSPSSSPEVPRLPIRRCLSMVDTTTPVSSRIHSIKEAKIEKPHLFASPSTISSFKRPQPPLEGCSPSEKKRRKIEDIDKSKTESKTKSERQPLTLRQHSTPETTEKTPPVKILRCHSESHLTIMRALNKSSNHNELTGDFSRPMVLPLLAGGKHPDLKCIGVHTMASLLTGEFKDKVDSFSVLDCRYPYEYEGGHIMNALNWYHPQMALEYLGNSSRGASPPRVMDEKSPRNIFIFHCEFSAERGPKAQRLLRETDRMNNKEHYPALQCPELYLLEGGYKAFFEAYPELCSPETYTKMIDEKFSDEFKHFRSRSKSWAAETKFNKVGGRIVARTGPKRLGL